MNGGLIIKISGEIQPVRVGTIQPFHGILLKLANWPALLLILAVLVETDAAENTTFVMESADKKLNLTSGRDINKNTSKHKQIPMRESYF